MASRWDQRKNRTIGTKEDVRIINNFLDQQIRKIENLAESLQNKGIPISAQNLMDYYKGKSLNSTQILAEFQNIMMNCMHLFPQEKLRKEHMIDMLLQVRM